MAEHHFAQVYYHDSFAGLLKEEAADQMSFTYDPSYLSAGLPPIAFTFPLQEDPFISHRGLHPFFDNLVSEGWLEHAQTRLLGKRQASRFELLMAFGNDCVGAVRIMDPDPAEITHALMDPHNPMDMAVIASRSSLSGVQPKLALVKKLGHFRVAKVGELSTHIGKFPSKDHDDLIINEYLTTLAFKSLLPHDRCVEMTVDTIQGVDQPALIIKRFDRTDNEQRIHFEEFNQLLEKRSEEKYDGSYKEMANFIQSTPKTLKTQIYNLFQRIITGILLGNTDMHLKNFAMFHTPTGFRLTPSYDQVAAALYQYKTLALKIGNTANLQIGNLKSNHIIQLGKEFGLNGSAIAMASENLKKNLEAAKESIHSSEIGDVRMKNQLINLLEKRWNGTFALIGKNLSKKP